MLFVPPFLVITSLRKAIWSREVQNCPFLYRMGFITPFSTRLLSLRLRCCLHSLHLLVSDTPGKGHQRAGLCGPAPPSPGTHRALNSPFFLQPEIFIHKESNFLDDVSFAKTGRRKGGCLECCQRHIVWILNLGLEGKRLKFFVSYMIIKMMLFFPLVFFFSVNRICQILA